MNGIEEAQQRWAAIRNKARRNGLVAVVVVAAVVAAIIALAGNAALAVIAGLVVLIGVGVYVVGFMGERITGLTINPEWKPLPPEPDDDRAVADDEDPDEDDAVHIDEEPVRRLDAQILGKDLTRLGQVVNPKLAKSYAMGDLDLTAGNVRWIPSVASARQGIEILTVEPAQVTSVERAVLWGSWALLRVATAEGAEWCMRIPNSVDLAPAFHDVGLTLQNT